MLEAKVIYLNNVISNAKKEPIVSDGGSFDEENSSQTPTKSKRSV